MRAGASVNADKESAAEWFIRLRQRHPSTPIRQLPHTPQRIAQVIRESTWLQLSDSTHSIQIRVRPICKHLREASIQVQRVVRRHTVYRLREPVSEAVVLITAH